MVYIQWKTSEYYVPVFNILCVISCTEVHSYVTVHVKLSLYTSLKSYRAADYSIIHFTLSTSWTKVTSFMSRPLSSQGKRPISIEGETVWAPQPIWTLLRKKKSFYQQSKHYSSVSHNLHVHSYISSPNK
jgi:hypothetical protein